MRARVQEAIDVLESAQEAARKHVSLTDPDALTPQGVALEAARQRFADPEHRARDRQRGSFGEGVFGFLRSGLGFTRWLLRGREGVRCEASLFQATYPLRKVHRLWAAA